VSYFLGFDPASAGLFLWRLASRSGHWMTAFGFQRHCGDCVIQVTERNGAATAYCKRHQTPPYQARKGEGSRHGGADTRVAAVAVFAAAQSQ